MNLGVETGGVMTQPRQPAQHSLMNLGVETSFVAVTCDSSRLFQHSLMNLGVETVIVSLMSCSITGVSAFSDESWGGDRNITATGSITAAVSAFSDESWGGDHG